jgi:hypothetical protein
MVLHALTPTWQLVLDKRDHNAAGMMSMFHKPIVEPDYVKRHTAQESLPGPGHYNPVPLPPTVPARPSSRAARPAGAR